MSKLRRERQRVRIVAETKREAALEQGCTCISIIGPSEHCAAHGGQRPLTEKEIEIFEKLARTIRDNRHLWDILASVPEDRREIVYKQISPFVKFKCLPWSRLLANFCIAKHEASA